jgi:PAS domain S-box-containing protein
MPSASPLPLWPGSRSSCKKMKSPLRILYLEDDPRDAELVQETLASDGIRCQVTRVETEADFIASLEQTSFDLILADYTLPSFDGLSALKIAQQKWPHVPLIFVSGTLGEEVAIEALKIGATDYVFKTRLSRIVPSVQRALHEAEERIDLTRAEEALRRSEAYLAEAQKLSHTGSFGWDVSSGKIYWSQETFRIFEYDPPTEPTLESVFHRTHPEDRALVRQTIDRVSQERKQFDFEHRLLMPNGSVKYLRVVGRPSKGESGSFEFMGAVMDISDLKRAAEMRGAMARERERLAAEIHDALAQSFTGISMQLGVAGEQLAAGEGDPLNQIRRANEIAKFGLAQARRSILSLQSSAIEESGLTTRLQRLVETSNVAGLLRCDFRSDHIPEERLPPRIQHELMRFAQEAISNAVRHASPTVVSVTLRWEPPHLVLQVKDNGSGISGASLEKSEGFGLRNMRIRASQIDGKLDIHTTANHGTSIVLTVAIAS